MSDKMIKNSSVSFTRVKEDILNYLKGLNNYEEIKDNLPDSTLTVIIELIAGYAVYNSHSNQMNRQETYLSTAQLETSVYNIAKAFGYYINRATAPVITVKYLAVPSIPLQSGTVIGKYKDLDIVYFGEDRIIEKLDEVDFVIGYYNTLEKQVQLVNGEFILEVVPQLLKSVDNDQIQLFVNDNPRPLSKAIEDFVVHQKAVDYSLNVDVSKLFIADMDNQYGLIVADKADVVKVKFIETSGMLVDFSADDLTLDEDFMYLATSHEGSNGESLEKIKRLAPLFYSTLRRAVTDDDLTYISEAHPLMLSTQAERDLGIPLKDKIEINAWSNETISININGIVYEIVTEVEDTKATALRKLYDKIKNNSDTNIRIYEEDNYIELESIDSRIDFSALTYSDNLTVTSINKNVKPACCTTHLYYIKYNVTDEPKLLTNLELQIMSEYLSKFKLSGLRVIFIPANVNHLDFKVKINLSNADYYDEVLARLKDILSKYELKLNTGFNYGSVLVALSQIGIYNGDELIKPVISVVPNQEVYNIEASKYSYLKFQNIEIELVD